MEYVKHEEGAVKLEIFDGVVARFTIGTMRLLSVDLRQLVSVDVIADTSGMKQVAIDGLEPIYMREPVLVPFLNAWMDAREYPKRRTSSGPISFHETKTRHIDL